MAHALIGLWPRFEIVLPNLNTNIHLESDCQVIVNQLNGNTQDFSPLVIVVEGFKRLLFSINYSYNVSFCSKQANRTTHTIAQVRMGLNLDVI